MQSARWCRNQVAVGKRDLNLGAAMAELPKAEREIKHADVDYEAKQPVIDKQSSNRADPECEANDDHAATIHAVLPAPAFRFRSAHAEICRTPP